MNPPARTLPSIKLTYFDFEGLAEPVRLTLWLAGIEFEDIRINWMDWPELKPKTPFGFLPVMEFLNHEHHHGGGDSAVITRAGGKMKAQSGAMLRYCGRLAKDSFLYPTEKLYNIEEVIGFVTDFNNAFMPCLLIANRPHLLGYPEKSELTEEGKERTMALRTTFYKDMLPTFLDMFEKLLDKTDGQWLVCGDRPTIADCFAVPTLRRFTCGYIDCIPTNCLETHPKVVQYLERFCAISAIQGRYTTGVGSVVSITED